MFELRPFSMNHLRSILDQDLNAGIRECALSDELKYLECEDAATFYIDGSVMVCGGISEVWPGRGHVWSVFSEESREHFVPTFRAMKNWLKYKLSDKYRRLELSVPVEWVMGHRRAVMLGFKLETPVARNYDPDGKNSSIYVMLRGE